MKDKKTVLILRKSVDDELWSLMAGKIIAKYIYMICQDINKIYQMIQYNVEMVLVDDEPWSLMAGKIIAKCIYMIYHYTWM